MKSTTDRARLGAMLAPIVVAMVALSVQTSAVGQSPQLGSFPAQDAGGGTLDWTAQAATVTGGNWLTISALSGSARSSSAASIQVSASAAGK